MKGYDPMDSFDARAAELYDETDVRGDEAATVALLAELARGGPALELAVGTGRIALPLAEQGIRVDGIEMSEHMVARLREKPGGERIAVTIGDMAEVAVDGAYRLIYLVFNTLYNLLTQEKQVRCFVNAAAHLMPDGCFVVEGLVPSHLMRLRDDQYVDAERVERDRVTLDIGRYDPVQQTLVESHVVLSPDGLEVFPIVTRYAWPSELDLMARIAGLRLQHRWGGWSREPFTASSRNQISVYGR